MNNYQKDVIDNLFTDKYSIKEKALVLKTLEKSKELDNIIKEYYPKHYDPNGIPNVDRVMKGTLIHKLLFGKEYI